MHVTCMDHVEHKKGDGEAKHAYVMRECFERVHVEGRVPKSGGGGRRARRVGADDEHKPQYEPQP